MKRFATISISLFLPIWLTSCGPITRSQVLLLEPPSELLQDCKVDDTRPSEPTTDDIIASRNDYRSALSDCNADKRGLRAWLEEQRALQRQDEG